jgi:hypothetical protein
MYLCKIVSSRETESASLSFNVSDFVSLDKLTAGKLLTKEDSNGSAAKLDCRFAYPDPPNKDRRVSFLLPLCDFLLCCM